MLDVKCPNNCGSTIFMNPVSGAESNEYGSGTYHCVHCDSYWELSFKLVRKDTL
jgi:DNA-directed RNA polymerase subunit RPC12/RpoP